MSTPRVASTTLALLMLAACASVDPGGVAGPPAGAPTFNVGDTWVYAARDGFRAPVVWEERHEVTAVGPHGIVVRVRARGPQINVERTERWIAPGVVASGAVYAFETKRFDPPIVRYRYPLVMGETWSQRLRDIDQESGPYGMIQRYTSVGGYERITTPAGTFDTIRLRVFMRLDDETFWRTPTECSYLVWYAPALGVSVREEREGEYREKGDVRDPFATIRVQHAELTLVSHTRKR
ncbi:MAG TPA: hypothetical protein VNG69_14490 [Casimicrobiaceae bacterium]|nr:hypothetical protein [Casimicrobiaceae bacterium]